MPEKAGKESMDERETGGSMNGHLAPHQGSAKDTSSSLVPLREEQLAYDIYRSISSTSDTSVSQSHDKNSHRSGSIAPNDDDGEVMGNQFSFLVRKHDFQQSRYRNAAEEEADKRLRTASDEDIADEVAASEHPSNNQRRTEAPSDRPPVAEENSTPPKSNSKFKTQDFVKSIKKRVTRPKKTKTKHDEDKTETIKDGNIASRLIGQLCLGSVGMSLLASCLLEDETGISRVPLLLSLVGYTITDISPSTYTKNRKFRFDLVYGVGPQKMKWLVNKSLKDLLYMHLRIKIDSYVDGVKGKSFPKFPSPNWRTGDLRGNRQKHRRQKSIAHGTALSDGTNQGTANDAALLSENDRDVHSIVSGHTFRDIIRPRRSVSSADDVEHDRLKQLRNAEFVDDLYQYFADLIVHVALRAQLNRIFQFFELSPISSLLSYETGYIGKQGLVHIGGSTSSQGWRVGHLNASDVKGMIDRRSAKWFLVRNTYVMYVKNINSTSPLDVFLVDPEFTITTQAEHHNDDEESDYDDSSVMQQKLAANSSHADESKVSPFLHLKITLRNAERKLVLIPKSRSEQHAWYNSLQEMKNSTQWSLPNRFNSFAPVRENCFAQWFVDGRDHMWAVSAALEMAKDVIFIHDWWLSPQLYLRRPASGNQQWRIDRLLQRKAQQGVKIYIIVYRNVGNFTPIDSLYTKHLLLSLSEENIHVIRSPNQLLQNTYFWAHHEKLCIVDQSVAFVGGIDLCYGRWDTPEHVLTDDSGVGFSTLDDDSRSTVEKVLRFQTFPGKDYSNPRVKDFSALDKPYESMYDRDKTPRMPWHDVHMMTTGKVARDLSRHFVQRWNYLIRQKRPSRLTPLLVPPPDMSDQEAKALGYEGTCEVQLLRSSGSWSLGLKETEHSIQNAYLKIIETSEHFVYIENQFFVTSCFIEGTEIKNRVGDALVERIIRAYNENEPWKAIIVIPLMPGFQSEVDESDGSSVRVIMQCQYMSISKGKSSIFAKLRKYGIDPTQYIQFFSLRKWGRIGPDRLLVTEQLYIHAKTIIVDDKIALIGSANINERSMRGSRDSEVAAIVRDSATVQTTMNGKPYVAAKFAHSLRMRLMREHLGIDIDILDIVERRFKRFEDFAETSEGLAAATNDFEHRKHAVLSAMVELASRDILDEPSGTRRWKEHQRHKDRHDIAEPLEIGSNEEQNKWEEPKVDQTGVMPLPTTFNNRTGAFEANKGIRDRKKHSFDPRVQHNEEHFKDVQGEGIDKFKTKLARKTRLTCSKFVKNLAHRAMDENPHEVFLPDIENVVNFLEEDDALVNGLMDAESEIEVQERNKERWRLLKTLSYLQRVAAKQKKQGDVESARNNTSSGVETFPAKEAESADSTTAGNGNADFTTTQLASDAQDDEKGDAAEGDSDQVPTILNEEIPVVTLNDSELRDTINGLSSRPEYKNRKYVDPYGFLDPVCDEFFDDIWRENSARNTKIFRMVFHSQPDSMVSSWKDYKLYSKLQKAFLATQQKEARAKRYKHGSYTVNYNDESELESEDEEEESPKRKEKPGMTPTINARQFDEGGGILGDVPPRPIPEARSSSRSFKKSFRASRHKTEAPPELADDLQEMRRDRADTVDTAGSSGLYPLSKEDDRANNHTSPKSSESSGEPIIRRKRAGTAALRKKAQRGELIYQRETAEKLLNETQGHLVDFPTEWLLRELESGNWFYNTDRLPPLEIYS